MSNGDMEQRYYTYVASYIENELKDNFKHSIGDSDNSLLFEYSNQVLERLLTCIIGLKDNPDFQDYLLNEILLSSQIGFVLNSATQRFSLESSENNTFIEHRRTKKIKLSLKESLIVFLLKLLNKKITIIK